MDSYKLLTQPRNRSALVPYAGMLRRCLGGIAMEFASVSCDVQLDAPAIAMSSHQMSKRSLAI